MMGLTRCYKMAVQFLHLASTITRSAKKVSLKRITTEQSRRHFYRAANAIFGRIGRIVTEDVTLHLLRTKCMPILLYGLEACPMKKSDLNSLDFAVNRFFMKLFRTGDYIILLNLANHTSLLTCPVCFL